MGRVVYLVRDLIFSARIREVAAELGVAVESAASPEALTSAARGAGLVILDLRLPEALEALRALAGSEAAGVPSVGFADHERTDLMRQATALGLGRALAKGQFAADLPRLLAG